MKEIAVRFLGRVRRWREQAFPEAALSQVPQARAYVWTALAALFLPVYLLVVQRDWLLTGGMWAEMGTNYFPVAHAAHWLDRIFDTDSGYIPLPQRLIAMAGTLVGLKAGMTAYYYNWAAVAGISALVASFCLPHYRALVRDDVLRFAVCVVVLMTSDFETRTFINFTYYGLFFGVTLTSLALVRGERGVPIWAWVLPLLILSKPVLLALVPVVLVVGCIGSRRFARVAWICTALAVAQVLRLMVSQAQGVMQVQGSGPALWAKLAASAVYAFSFLGMDLVGPHLYALIHSVWFLAPMAVGLIATVFLAVWLKKRSSPSRALVLVGLPVLALSLVLNCFALVENWNLSCGALFGKPFGRSVIAVFFVVALLVAALVDDWARCRPNTRTRAWAAALIFMVWFVASDWMTLGLNLSKAPAAPMLGNSQWQAQARRIDAAPEALCVPLDPFGWVYMRDCAILNPGKVDFLRPFRFDTDHPMEASKRWEIAVPAAVGGHRLLAVGLVVRSLGGAWSTLMRVLGKVWPTGLPTGRFLTVAECWSSLRLTAGQSKARGACAWIFRCRSRSPISRVRGVGSLPLCGWASDSEAPLPDPGWYAGRGRPAGGSPP